MSEEEGRDVEALARPEVRAGLPAWRLLWLYLDPFCLFKSITTGTPANQTEAMRYNRRHRRILLDYVARWAAIGGLCLGAMAPLAARAAADPVLIVPIVGLELGFSAAVFMLVLSLAVYVLLGQER